jgi:hypothetical protein
MKLSILDKAERNNGKKSGKLHKRDRIIHPPPQGGNAGMTAGP